MKLVVALPARRADADPRASPRSRCVLDRAKASILNPGPHGLSEVVYAFTSAANNNGSAFGGLTGNTDWYNTTLGLAMLGGRFLLIVPVLAIAGSLARKQPVPPSAGTFPTDTPLFAGAARRRRPDRRRRSRTSPSSRSARSSSSWACDAAQRAPLALRPRRSCGARRATAFVKLDPRRMARNPVMFVVEIGSVLVDRASSIARPERLRRARRGLALVHGAVRELRRGDRRGPRQGAGRRRCARRAPRRSRTAGAPDGVARGRARARRCASATRSSSPPAR